MLPIAGGGIPYGLFVTMSPFGGSAVGDLAHVLGIAGWMAAVATAICRNARLRGWIWLVGVISLSISVCIFISQTNRLDVAVPFAVPYAIVAVAGLAYLACTEGRWT
jgi:hypothetical protein